MRAVFARVVFLVLVGLSVVGFGALAEAANDRSIFIRTLIVADLTDTDSELIEIENRGTQSVDVTGWSLAYVSSTGTITPLRTIKAKSSNARVFIDPGVTEAFLSTKYISGHPLSSSTISYNSAEQFTGRMAMSTGGLELRDGSGDMVDGVRWGNWASGDGATSLTASTLLRRKEVITNISKNDFIAMPQVDQVFSFGNLYELADLCMNIEGFQFLVPEDMKMDEFGGCISSDVCPNLSGVQTVVPDEMEFYQGNCLPIFQPKELFITEILGNPSGVDSGFEYVEFYNASDSIIQLNDYYLTINNKRIVFPVDLTIAPDAYLSLSDSQLGIVLPNTNGVSIQLMSRNDLLVDSTPNYSQAPIDLAWAWINDSWQYTNQPTPGEANQPSLVDDGELPAPDSSLVVCREGYYRNPLTNRCNKIAITEVLSACKPNQYRSEETGRCRNYATLTMPVACRENQYRSEETGRCRSIVQTVVAELKPCNDDQFRNPATGRCKKIASTDDIPKPCVSGYERNAETNRCRKIPVSSMPVAAFPVEPIAPSNSTIGVWLAIGGVVVGGLSYAAWEWRHEIASGLRRLAAKLGRKV